MRNSTASSAKARKGGLGNLDECMRHRLEPLIASTLVFALPEKARTWASGIASSDPAHFDVRVPFEAEEDWIEWGMATRARPCTIYGPGGSDILEEEAVDRPLRQAATGGAFEGGARRLAAGGHDPQDGADLNGRGGGSAGGFRRDRGGRVSRGGGLGTWRAKARHAAACMPSGLRL